MLKLLSYLDRRSATSLMVLAFLIVVALGLINFYAGPDISVLFFYVIPIFLAAWFVSKRAGVLITLLSGVSWLIIAWLSPEHFSNPAIPFWNAIVRFGLLLVTSILVSDFRRSLDHEREQARTDFLTGAVNSRSFREQAEAEINRAERNGHPFAIAYMDIDDFKVVNDRFGHTTGDACYERSQKPLRGTFAPLTCVARLGGDEFAILLPRTDSEAAQIVVLSVAHKSALCSEEE